MTLAISQLRGVEMKRPGLGDLAGRGAAYGLTPDLWKRYRASCLDLSTGFVTCKPLFTVRIGSPSHLCRRPPAALVGGRVANRGASQDNSYLGAPTVSAQRERPGARKGAAARPSEVDGVMRLHTGRSRRALQPSAGQGSPLPSAHQRASSFGSGYHDNG